MKSPRRAREVRPVPLHDGTGGVGPQARSAGTRDRVQAGDDPRDRGRQHHELRRRSARARIRFASAPRSARAGSCPTCISPVSATIATTIEKTLTALQALEMHNIFSISGDWPKAAQNTAVFDIDSVQLAAAHRRSAGAHRDTVLHFVRGLSVQVPARGSPLPVPEAREEDRRRRRHGDHASRLGRDEVRRAEEVSRRARPEDAGARQRLRAQPARRRAHEHRQSARMLGVRRARRGAEEGIGSA